MNSEELFVDLGDLTPEKMPDTKLHLCYDLDAIDTARADLYEVWLRHGDQLPGSDDLMSIGMQEAENNIVIKLGIVSWLIHRQQLKNKENKND